MISSKSKFYLKIAGVIMLGLTPLYWAIYHIIQTDHIYKNGIVSKATIQDITKSLPIKNRTTYYYKIKYKDASGKTYIEKLSFHSDNRPGKFIGEEIEIIYDKDNPEHVSLLNHKKYYDTEERVIAPDDLVDFFKRNNKEYILNKLNKISEGWKPYEDDSTIFINKRRNSYLRVNNDSACYLGNIRFRAEINSIFKKMKHVESGKFIPKILVHPFKTSDAYRKFIITELFNIYELDSFKIKTYSQIDVDNKPWLVITCKR